MKQIQRVELRAFYHHSIFCPFCGAKVMDQEEAHAGSDSAFNPCIHTLFYAHDVGFEYRSKRFDTDRGIDGVDHDDVDMGDTGYDGFTDVTEIPDALKFAAYVGPPSGFGAYVGFAPTDEA